MWIKARTSVPVVFLVVGFSTAITFWATRATVAQTGTQPGNCACVAVVDLPTVMQGLTERGEAQTKLIEMAEEMQAEDTRRRESLVAKQAEIDAHPEGDPVSIDLQQQIALEALEYQSWRLFANERIDIEKSVRLRDLHQKMSTAIDDLAAANGYDLVLMNDAAAELGINHDLKVSREAQIRTQITSRRIMYANDQIDITDDLIERMNNAFNAGG